MIDRPRVLAVDVARTAAILGMVIFHFTRDLEIFGLIEPGTTLTGGWAVFARVVAGSFLFLVGFSLVLAHAGGIRWRAYGNRLTVVALAAMLITIVTYAAVPSHFIYFGILHAIAASSLIAIWFVLAPAWVAGSAAILIWVLHFWIGREIDLPVWLGWTGLGTMVRPSLDFLPLVPWLAPSLLGVAAAKAAFPYLGNPSRAGPLFTVIAWPGRHSLAIYLLHQPIILGLMWLTLRAGLVG